VCFPRGVPRSEQRSCSMLLLLMGLLPLDRRNMTGTPAGVSGQLRRLSDMEGVEGEGTSPRLMAHTPPLETVANRSAPMGCGPNVDQARPARRRQRRTALRPCRRKADPACCPRQATPPGNRLGRGALAGSGPGASTCIDGCPWSPPWSTPASCLSKPCARRWLPGYARHQADHRPGLRRVARSDARGTIVPKRAVEPERSRPRPPLRRCRC
jgi:hypothetical protein